MANQAASVEYLPLGVVGVIGPWNYPVFTPMGSIAYALAAGNAVVFKPSELHPRRRRVAGRRFREVVVGPRLSCRSSSATARPVPRCAGPASTSSRSPARPATGKKVMAACAENLTPVLIEAGGKDALLVDEDADVEAAADAALWGACSNAGQTCTGVERVYVHERVYDEFLARARRQGRGPARVTTGRTRRSARSRCPSRSTSIRRHIDDALARGGRAVVGGVDAVGERFVQPTVLVDVPEDSLAITEETFGPTVTVAKVRDMDEAVERANATRYGLGVDGVLQGARHGARPAAPLRDDRRSTR